MKIKNIIVIFMILLFTGCSVINYNIDKDKYQAIGKNERIRFIVIHYTATDDALAIRALTKGQVSSHYLITTQDEEPIYNLVPLEQRAWHAGLSEFAGRNNINDTSIGIEIVNKGLKSYNEKEKRYGFFIPREEYICFTDGQIKKLAFLLKGLIERYDIKPKNILGHSDVAPTRKIDPGPNFPWEKLYREYGIGAWYEDKDKNFYMNEKLYRVTPVSKIKEEFRKYGYKINNSEEWDEESRRVVYNFQAHFTPNCITGDMNLETFAIIKALNKKYK